MRVQGNRVQLNLFKTFVGKLQPILSTLPGKIAGATLASGDREQVRKNLTTEVENEAVAAEVGGFDLDEVAASDLEEPVRPLPLYDLDDLGRVLGRSDLLPPGLDVRPLYGSNRQFSFSQPGMNEPIRITTDPAFYEEHPESVELWSPGSPTFPHPEEAFVFEDLVRNRDMLATCFRRLRP